MARRNRRRGGAHSASRKGDSSPGSPVAGAKGADSGGEAPPTASELLAVDAATTTDTPSELLAVDATATDTGTMMSRKDRRAAGRGAANDHGPDRAAGPTGKRRKRRRWLDRVLLGSIIVVVLALLTVGTSYVYVQYRFNQVAKVTVKHLKPAPAGQPFNVLLIGSDSRSGESTADAAHFGSATINAGQRSDVVKIVHIVPATGQASVLSIPRDTMVTVAGNTSSIGKYDRINATYDVGPDQLVQTIEANFGIPIEHVVQVNFAGLRGAVDAIGGINVNFPYPAKDAYTGLNVTQPGCQMLNGGYSLALARSRHYEYERNGYWQFDGTSDFGRIQRQNAFLRAVINQAEAKYNPLTLNAFIGSVVQGVTVDSTFSVGDLISLARQFHTFSSQSLATATLPTYDAYSSEFGYLGAVLYVQQPQANQVITQFLGQPPDAAFTPPPGPYGVVPTTTTTTTVPSTPSTGGFAPATSSSSSTTTSIETDFNPTPC